MKKIRHTARRTSVPRDGRDRPGLLHHSVAGAVSGAVRALVTWLISVATDHGGQ
ncbi:hypothetical protein [Streptomyces sp. NPDC002176]|uniref:hypothetical protein n=1 Tax=Streptomyces sp. NPDC002176 TaxID=3364634 RepID=UPI00384A5710